MELDNRAIEISNVGLGGNNCDTVIYVDMDVCAGSVLSINNQSVSADGLYTDSLTSVGGCDSVVVYNVMFQAHFFYYSSDSICNGDSIKLGDTWRKDPGLYYDTLTSAYGCDSVLGVYLSYKDSTHIQRQIYKCKEDSVFAAGAWQVTPGIYYDSSYSVALCDSFIVTEIIDYPNPNLQANVSSTMICEGDSVTLSSIGSGTKIWNTGQIGNFTCYPTVTSIYEVSAIDLNGCFDSDSVTVDVLPKPILVVDSLIDLCDGDSVLLNASSSSPVIWNGGLSNGANVSPSQSTNYIATTINSFGCSTTDLTKIKVHTNPTLSIPVSFSICKEDSVGLNGISNGNVNWNIGTGNNVMIKPQVSSTYYVTATNAIGCESIDSLQISVLPLPILNINNITPICEGQSTTLYANTNGTLNWNVGIGNNILVSPSSTTAYFVSATHVNGCQRKDSVEVVVYSNPVLAVVNTPTICTGDSMNLTAVSNGNITWGIGGSNPVMVSPLTTTNYTVTATSIYGCTTEDSTTLVVNPTPTLTINPIAPICESDSTQLIAISSGIVQWNIGVGNTQIVSPSQNTMYYANVTSALGCEINDSVLVSVLPKPNLNIIPVSPICDGDAAVLNASTSGQIQWNLGTGNTITVSPTVNTYYTVTATGLNGCQNDDSVEVVVWPIPTLTLSSNDTICEGDTVILNAISNGQILWSAGSNPLIATPNSTTAYYVTATNTFGCLIEDSVEVMVRPTPTMSVNNVSPICLGQSVVLHANATSSTAVSWSAGTGNTIVINPSNSGVYKATAVNTFGCETSDSVLVTVYPIPTLNLNNITSVCYGEVVTLSAVSNGNIVWNMGQGNPVQVNLNSSSLCIATANNSYGCVKKDSVYVNVMPELALMLQSPKTTICKGDSIKISALGNGMITWGLGQVGNITVAPQTTQTYQAMIQNSLGCTDTSEITIEVNDIPDLNISGDTTICRGDGVVLNATGTGIIKWNSIIPNGRLVRPQTTTVYEAKATGTNHCENKKLKTITVNQLPVINMYSFTNPSICVNDFNGVPIPQAFPIGGTYNGNGIQNGYFYPQIAGIGSHVISYEVVDGNGCKNNASTTISVSLCTDVEEAELEGSVKVFPNPVNNQLNIDLQWGTSESITYMILDVSGKEIQSGNLQDMMIHTTSVKGLSRGMYILKVDDSKRIKLIKFIKN
jgi:hypothetical protein